MIRSLGLFAVLAGTAAPTAPAHARGQAACETGADNMAEVRACESDKLQADLKATFADVLGFVRARDGEAARLLETAQRSWARFFEDSCSYTVAARQTELMSNDARLNCAATFINARIKVLKAYRRDFGKADQ